MAPFTISLEHASYDNLDLLDSFDVIVLGGGPAGIAASTTAAEKGHRTLLIERLGFCGGAAVSGMSGTICGLYNRPRLTFREGLIIFVGFLGFFVVFYLHVIKYW